MVRVSLRHLVASAAILCPLALSTCQRQATDGELELLCDDEFSGPWGGIDIRSGMAVDILFVIDNSGSMAPHQVKLNAGVAALFERLDETHADYRIAFTTSDDGNPWCPAGVTTPEGGKFVLSSCKNRLGDFLFNNGAVDAQDLACNDQCSLADADLTISPTSTGYDSNLVPRPWMERVGETTNLPAGTDPVEAFKCFAPQGINGCGFESQLESMYLALTRAANEQEPEYGFVRNEALLVVVIVTDEADCSYNKQWSDIFAQDGNRVFWEDPSASFPSSAVCWNAGVECSGDPSAYDSCEPMDYDINGQATADPSKAVLQPLDRYRGLLQGLEQTKQEYNADQEVLVMLIAGVEGGGQDWSVSYADAADPDVQLSFGIGPGCTGADGLSGVPPVRMRALTSEFDEFGLWSVCEPDFSDAMAGLGERIAEHKMLGCYGRCAADRDRSTPQLEPACTVQTNATGERTNVAECERGADGNYLMDPSTTDYQVPDGADMCFAMLVDPDGTQTSDPNDQLSPECMAYGANLEFVLVRRPGYSEPSNSWVDADCMLSGCPDLQCPQTP